MRVTRSSRLAHLPLWDRMDALLGSLLHTLDTLHEVAHTMGLRFNKDKTEVYHWAKDYNLEPITWQHQLIPVCPPIMTYLGHVLAHPTQEDIACGHGDHTAAPRHSGV